MAKITITGQDIKTARDSLIAQSDTVGKHQYSKSLFNEDGISLRLQISNVCTTKQVVDEEAKVKQDEELAAKKQEMIATAASKGLTLDQYKEELKAEERQKTINMYSEEQGITIEEATKQVEDNEIAQLRYLKQEFVRSKLSQEEKDALNKSMTEYYKAYNQYAKDKAAVAEGEEFTGVAPVNPYNAYIQNMNQEEFATWKKAREEAQETPADPMKDIVVVEKTNLFGIVYSFNEDIVGVAGFNTLAKANVETVEGEEIPSEAVLKQKLAAYVNSAEFTKGLAFIARITGVDIDVEVA